MPYRKNITQALTTWWRDQRALAATEFALIFPILFMMMLATVELGNAIMANQKAILASQMMVDLITRSEAVTTAQLNETKAAGRLALTPFDTDSVGFDIISIRYLVDSADEGTEPDPEIVWRDTDNMDGLEAEVEDIKDKVLPLALAGDGVVMVYVRFPYKSAFGSRFVGDLNMIEVSYARGRKNPVVVRSGS